MAWLDAFLIFSCYLMLILDISLADTFDVTKFGAHGNGKDDDSKAFLSTWTKVCASSSNAIMLVPKGKTYLLSPLLLEGPCKGNYTRVQIDGTLVAPKIPNEWSGCTHSAWIVFSNVDFLGVYGKGEIDGQGLLWWKKHDTKPIYDEIIENSKIGGACTRPIGLRFFRCNNLELRGLTHINPPGRHINIFECNHVQISKLQITAPGESPNTDGIGISYSTNVNITNSIISTGDDCIAISNGCSNIFVQGVQCGPGHGISVGSLGEEGSSADVNDIYVRNCTFNGTTNGARIKTWQGGKGYAKNINFEDIQLHDVKNCIIIDQNYCNGGHSCTEKGTGVQLSDLKFRNVRGTSSVKQAILLDCSKNVTCKNIILDNVSIKTSSTNNVVFATCNYAEVFCRHRVSPTVTCNL